VPPAMRNLSRWALWRETRGSNGKPTKKPFTAAGGSASSTNPDTWTDFPAAGEAYANGGDFDGIGVMLGGPVDSQGRVLYGIDFDTVLDERGRIRPDFPVCPDVAGWIAGLAAFMYIERSPSGTGLKAFGIGPQLPGWARRRVGGKETGGIEVYPGARFFTVTGDVFEHCVLLEPHDGGLPRETLEAFLEAAGMRRPEKTAEEGAASQPLPPLDLDDQTLLEVARAARNGSDFSLLYDRGSWKTAGYPSQSEADCALCRRLAFYWGPRPEAIDRMFRRSALMREKWNRADYSESTIAAALDGLTDFYSPRANRAQDPRQTSPGDATTGARSEQPADEGEAVPSHSWTPINLAALALEPPAPPSIGGLVYPGARHVFSGETESLKTWAALVLCAEEITAGNAVVWIDFEMGPRAVYARLLALGLTGQQIGDQFIYVDPSEPLAGIARADLKALLEARKPTVAVIDALAAALNVHGLDPNKEQDIEKLGRIFIDPLRNAGAATISIDHVVKDTATRGKYASGSQRKIGISDVHLGFEVITPFGRGRTGLAKIITHKDRPAELARPKAAELELRSDPVTGAVTWTITPAGQTQAEAIFRPTNLMEKVSRYLEQQHEPVTQSDVERAVSGKAEWLRKALNQLVLEGHVAESEGPRSARLLLSKKAFREHDPVPTPSQ